MYEELVFWREVNFLIAHLTVFSIASDFVFMGWSAFGTTVLCIVVSLLLGCKPQRVADWRPMIVGGPLEVRPLPSSDEVAKQYRQWVTSATNAIARVYEVRLVENVFTNNFVFEQSRHETPLGRPVFTVCAFRSSRPEFSGYRFEFSQRGRVPQEAFDFWMGKTVWLQMFDPSVMNTNFAAPVRIQIIGIEGVRSPGVVPAAKF